MYIATAHMTYGGSIQALGRTPEDAARRLRTIADRMWTAREKLAERRERRALN